MENIKVSKVICFASAKGGTGKTTISATLAKFLVALGKKVLLVDMDAVTNGLTLLYVEEMLKAKIHLTKEEASAKGIFEVTEDEPPTPFTVEGSFDMIPSAYVLQQTEGIPTETFRSAVSKILSAFREEYDYIMFDLQAGSNIYAGIALESADEVVIVSEYDPISAVGVERLKNVFQGVMPYEKTWILLNKILPEFAKSFSEFLKIARYLSPIPWDAEVVRALATRRLAIDTEKGSTHTLAIMQTAISLLGEEIAEEVNQWKQGQEKRIREPVNRQLKELDEEIKSVEKVAIESQYELRDLQQKSKKFVIKTTIFLAIVIAVGIEIFYFLSEPFLYFSDFLFWLSIMLLALFIPLLLFFYRRIEKQSRKQAKEEESRYSYLAYNLEDLKERRKKYKTLSEYDLETFLRKRE
jgi:septum site-determining protein MinD